MNMTYLNPLQWGRWIGGFISLWVLSLPWGRVSHGLPALILVVALISGGVIAVSEGTGWRDGLLQAELLDAWERDDFDTAELIVRRQLTSKPDSRETLHNLALTLDAQGRREDAAEMMRQLVSKKDDDKSAQWLLEVEFKQSDWPTYTKEQREELGAILKLLYTERKNDIWVKNLYADYLMAMERYKEAIPILAELSQIQPMRGLQAAALSRVTGNNTNAELFAQRSLAAVSKMSEEDPSNTNLALSVAQNQLFLGRFAEAIRTLERVIPEAKTEEDLKKLRDALGDGVVAWIQFIEKAKIQSLQERQRVLVLLQKGLLYAPNNPRVMALVADHVLASMGDDSEEIVTLRQALIDGSSPGIAHFIQGTAALVRGEEELALRELKLSADLMPHSSPILNNLAVALAARGGEEDLQNAKKILDSAIENAGRTIPHFHETRGQVLFQMKRYQDAIPDLERALSHPDLEQKARESLASCYAELGEEELSRMHREFDRSKQ